MSLESAAAILEAANKAQPLVNSPGANPDGATLVAKHSEEKVEPKEEKKAAAVEEKPKEEEKPKDEEDQTKSKRFEMLAKKERNLFRRDQEIKAKQADVDEKLKALENFEKFKLEARKNPRLALKELGLTYDELTQYELTGNFPNSTEHELQSVRSEIENFKKEQLDKETRAIEAEKKRQADAVQKTISDFKSDIVEYIKTNQEKYELIALNQVEHLVYNEVDQHFHKTKRILSLEEASDIVEKRLEEQIERNRQAKKFQKRVETPPKKQDDQKPPSNQTKATISNEMTSSAPSFLPAKSERERMERAMAKLSN